MVGVGWRYRIGVTMGETMADDARSAYADMTADEAFASYWAAFTRTRAACLGAAAVLAIMALSAAARDLTAIYLVCLAGILACAVAVRAHVNKRFAAAQGILDADCDTAKWRRFMELVGDRSRRASAKAVAGFHLALCDYLDGDFQGALDRLAELRFRDRSIMWANLYNLWALACNRLGETAGRDRAIERLEAHAQGIRAGSEARRAVDDMLRSARQASRPAETWDAEDGAFIRDRLVNAADHRSRMEWRLRLAEYELARGSRDEARRLLDEQILEPMTPLARSTAEDLRARAAYAETPHKI